jgi:hypothetical protein
MTGTKEAEGHAEGKAMWPWRQTIEDVPIRKRTRDKVAI